jgi:hypothetical protein
VGCPEIAFPSAIESISSSVEGEDQNEPSPYAREDGGIRRTFLPPIERFVNHVLLDILYLCERVR